MQFLEGVNWKPLENLAAKFPQQIIPDLFMHIARFECDGIIVSQYKHQNTRRSMYLDDNGQAYSMFMSGAGALDPISINSALDYVLK